jgi:four helix bundle protein
MTTQSFKDLVVWNKATDLVVEIYRALQPIKDYGFRDQLQRAAVSVANNVAEGYARRSDRSFRHFLFIAKGSAAEVESMLILAERLGYIDETNSKSLIVKTEEVSRILSGFIKKLSAMDS